MLFSSSGELFLTLPTSLETSKASISSAGNGRSRSIGGWSVTLAVEPAVEVARVQDDGHTVVDRRHQLVRLGGDDGEALEPVVDRLGRGLRLLPRIPQTREAHHLAVGEVEGEGLLVLRVELLPLIEAGGEDNAASALEGFAKCARTGDRLGACVDGGDAFDVAEALGEERYEAPAHLHQLTLAGVAALADDGCIVVGATL